MDRDESLREVRKTIEDTKREVRNVAACRRHSPTRGVPCAT
jgi:hypothetical protein